MNPFRIPQITSFCLGFCISLMLSACQNRSETPSTKPGIQISPEDIETGRQLYTRYGCATCHAEDGSVNPHMAKMLNPKPRDFRDVSAYKQGNGVAEIAQMLIKGIPSGQGMGMSAYPHIPEDQRTAIAKFIVSLQK